MVRDGCKVSLNSIVGDFFGFLEEKRRKDGVLDSLKLRAIIVWDRISSIVRHRCPYYS